MLGDLVRRVLPPLLALLGIAAGTISSAAAAEPAAWPPKLVRIVVPFGAGSTPDIVGRVLADSLQARHPGSSFVVENKPGAAGNIGTDTVAKAAPDGATLGISIPGPLVINRMLFAKLPYDPDHDITPVTMLTRLPNVLVVPSSLGVGSVAEFVARLKAPGSSLAYASIGAGSLSQLCMEAIAQQAGAKLVHIPYAGSPNAVTALIRGDVQAACLPAISVAPQLASGTMKILAVSTPERSPFLPDVPTLKESGIAVQSDAWNALIAPRGTPPALVAAINAEVRQSLAEPGVVAKLKVQMITPALSSPDELRKTLAEEKQVWTDVIRAAGIRIE
ncbi:tripartite tricarboxylate transporter substrate binding protein [Rhodopseudomonas sp. HC1]|uniref:Bug family tripartite tricarboxylate transporter substrate binding protein n=1 Tax=Rhodopseudomonas infernalis TaxID=2897386 RepID=UPI001EE99915|nr:tripartite tricarboxylate transporter substrate binding protein [Rhodopseudomonas infernalis]MCG6204077.1 tripartite tricarboxylate transporter substrate binding protein [Rhodopseudomonas infernalis]